MRTAEYYRNQITGNCYISDRLMETVGPWLMDFDKAMWEMLANDPHIHSIEYTDGWSRIRVNMFAKETRLLAIINDDLFSYYFLPPNEYLFGEQLFKGNPRLLAAKYAAQFQELFETGLDKQIVDFLETERRYGF